MGKLNKINKYIKSIKNMGKFLDFIHKKINGVIITLLINGIILLILAVLIVVYNFMTRFTVGIFVFIIAYVCLYLAYKIWKIKKEITKYI